MLNKDEMVHFVTLYHLCLLLKNTQCKELLFLYADSIVLNLRVKLKK